MEEIKKTDEEIIFSSKIIAGIEVKPWSFGILFEISTMLECILDRMEEKKIFVDPVAGFISYFDMLRIFTMANQEVLKIISITTNKDIEEIKNLGMEDGIKLAITIYQDNSIILKNAVSSLFGTKMTETGAQSEELDSKE